MLRIKKRLLVSILTMTFMAAFLSEASVVSAHAEEELKPAKQCTFVIPSRFKPSSEKNLFIDNSYPMESGSIKYSVYYNGMDIVMTNREREEAEKKAEEKVIDSSGELTKKEYEELLSANYNKEYGTDVGFKVSDFDTIEIDGFPGYKIEASYKVGDEEPIYQTVYMIRSKFRTFTIIYQRAEDDECSESFEKSAETIHVM